MASGDLRTSTPVQYRHDSGFGSYGKGNNLSKSTVLELSPIRKQHSNLSAILRVCGILNAGGKCNNDINNVTKKLIFRSSSDVSNSDSGIQSESISTENQSSCKKLTTFSTDENCNIIWSSAEINKLHQPYKYICKEDIVHEKELNPSQLEIRNLIEQLDNYHGLTDLIGDKIVPKFDLFRELYIRNCTGILSHILSYLSGEDIRKASYVSKLWQHIVLSDKSARKKRESYISNKKNTSIGPDKENKFKASSPSERNHRSVLTNVINLKAETQQIHDNFTGRFDSFLEEVKTLTYKQPLMKCPKCHYPSKVQSGNKFCCTRKLCLHEFCKKCSGPYLKNHSCSVPELDYSLPNIVIGSKKSKKNLRRL